MMGLFFIFGICLGYQILGFVVGGQIFKMKFGYWGGNQLVKNLFIGNVEIISQNYGYVVDLDSIFNGVFVVIYVNFNDGMFEGMVYSCYLVFSVQYYFEVLFGFYDSCYFFDCFIEEIDVFDGGNGIFIIKVNFGCLGV